MKFLRNLLYTSIFIISFASCNEETVCLPQDWSGTYSGDKTCNTSPDAYPVTIRLTETDSAVFSLRYLVPEWDTISQQSRIVVKGCIINDGTDIAPGSDPPFVRTFDYEGSLSENELVLEERSTYFSTTTNCVLRLTRD